LMKNPLLSVFDRYPIRGTFVGCCASAITPRASNTTATRIDDTRAFFIAHLILDVLITRTEIKKSVIYGGRRYTFVEYKGQSHAEIELHDATVASCWIKSYENSIQSWQRRLVFFHHLITLSARASTFGGIVRPICLAVLRLITNSNFVGCSTGKSAGFLPFRILSTMAATRR
jgi:hypothetical protein